MRITLVTLLSSTKLLEPFLKHYAELGVTDFWIVVHQQGASPDLWRQAEEIARPFANVQLELMSGDWIANQNKVLSRLKEQPNRWFIVADHDEFILFTERPDALARECERFGFDHVKGGFVDRISANGSFRGYEPGVSLWDQYPTGAFLTYPICGADFRKIVLSRGSVTFTNNGHHRAKGGAGFPTDRMFVEVHHFKWTSDVLSYVRTRKTADASANRILCREASRLLAYCRMFQNQINLDDPSLMAGLCSPYYSRWPTIIQMVLIEEFRARMERLEN
jgi:hypothetical protein